MWINWDKITSDLTWFQYRVSHTMLDFGEWCGDVWTWLFT